MQRWLPEAPVLDDRVVVVEVWATWCDPCRDSFPVLARLQRQHPDILAVVALTDERLPAALKPLLAPEPPPQAPQQPLPG